MNFFDNVVNKSNSIIKGRLNNPFGQKQDQQQQPDEQPDRQKDFDTIAQQDTPGKQTITGFNDETNAESIAHGTKNQEENGDQNSQFAAIAADAEAVAQKAAKSAQKFGSFLFSMANKAGQSVSQTAKQVKQAVESTSILNDFTREQQEFLREHGGSMQAGELPWMAQAKTGDVQEAKVVDENLREQILTLSQDKRNFVRGPPKNANYNFDGQKFYPIALSLLKEDPELSKMRYELVPKLVNEDTFWCNYFFRVEMLKLEANQAGGDGRGLSAPGDAKRAGWASSRSSSSEGPDDMTSSGQHGLSSVADDGPLSPGYVDQHKAANKSQDYNRSAEMINEGGKTTATNTTTTTTTISNQESLTGAVDQLLDNQVEEPTKVDFESEDLKNLLGELNIGTSSGRDAKKNDDDDEDDDEWDEELQREFELVSGDLSGLEEEEDLKNELLELERTHKDAVGGISPSPGGAESTKPNKERGK